MIVLYQGVCYIKDIKVYKVMLIVIVTEITRLPKNIVVLENLDPSKNLAPPAPLRI